MNLNPRLILAGAAGLIAVASARAQAPTVCAPADRSIDAQSCVAYRAIVDSARKLKLPTRPLEDKALQGVLSESDGPPIVASVRKLLDGLDQARKAMGSASTEAELKLGAEALDAGATPNDLALFRRATSVVPAAHKRSLEVALTVFTELAAQVPVAAAANDLRWMLTFNVTDRNLQKYQRDVQSQIANSGGADPTTGEIVANQLARAAIAVTQIVHR